MKAAIVVFPGTNRERDMRIALKRVTGRDPLMLFHREELPKDLDLVVLAGGFSYGDYLRCGAMAAQSPIMKDIKDFAAKGGHILGVCNGFQILIEAGLLPGGLLRNASTHRPTACSSCACNAASAASACMLRTALSSSAAIAARIALMAPSMRSRRRD